MPRSRPDRCLTGPSRLAAPLFALLLATAAAAQTPAPLGPLLRLTSRAFGVEATVEIAGLDAERAEPAGRAALVEIGAAEATVGPDGPLAALALSPDRPVPLERPLLQLLERTLGFCLWTEGRLGPLGGELYARWGLRHPVGALPTPEALAAATASADCRHLRVDARTGTATLAAGSRIELWGFERGWAIDRAVERLQRDGISNARVRIGRVQRAFGPGPALQGNGWMVDDLRFPGQEMPLAPVALVDRALAAASLDDARIEIAGESFLPYFDLRDGKPARGVVAAIASSRLAIDAQGLATAMAVTGSRQGQFLLGSLRGDSAVLWLLGSGQSESLLEGTRWSTLRPR